MLRICLWIRNLLEGEEGQDLVEYALIVFGVSIVLVTALAALSVDIGAVFTNIGDTINAPAAGGG